MDILKSSQLVIFSHSTIFITFSYRSLAGFLFKLLRSSRRWKPEVALDFCVWPLCGLAPEASNIPNEIQVLNWGLIWSLYYSSDEQIIEMISEFKFAIINLLIHSWEEHLTSFDCNWQMKLTSNASRAVWFSMEKQTVAHSGISLVWHRWNQLLTG